MSQNQDNIQENSQDESTNLSRKTAILRNKLKDTNNSRIALETIQWLADSFDGIGESMSDILGPLFGEGSTLESVRKTIAKKERRSKKKNVFIVKGLKKPLTAYLLYSKDQHQTNKGTDEWTNMDMGAQSRAISASWKKLSAAKKRPFTKRSVEAKKQYELEYNRLRDEAITNGSFVPDPPKVKGPRNAYMLWSNDKKTRASMKKKYPKMSGKELSKKKGELWGSMTDTQKEPWAQKASEDRERYNRERQALAQALVEAADAADNAVDNDDGDATDGVDAEAVVVEDTNVADTNVIEEVSNVSEVVEPEAPKKRNVRKRKPRKRKNANAAASQ